MARPPAEDEAGALGRALRAGGRRQAAALAVECALLGLGAAGATAAAAALDGSSPQAPGTLLAAGLAGFACAASWWLERREDPARLARRIDRGTVGDGSFVTAVECEREGRRGALVEALLARTRGRVAPADARRAMRPPAVALLAAPLLALALLVQLGRPGGRGAEGPGAPPGAAEPSLEAVAAALRGATGEGPGGERDPELERLLADALAREGDGAGLRRALERLSDALARRLEAGGGDPGGARTAELGRALELVRAAGAGAGPEPDGGGASGPGGGSTGRLPSDPGSATSGVPRDRSLDAGGAGATMAGSPEPEGDAGSAAHPSAKTGATTGAAATAAGPEPGVLAGRTWDVRYDGVVDAWLRRAGASGHDFE